jgi:DNA-binding GntR family transcriptional regulator
MAEILSMPTALHGQVTQRLRQLLVEMKVSRTPLREAIKTLAAEGLVELLPNRGAIAVQLGEADILNTFEVMAGLEGMSGELAAQRITPEELTEIEAMHYEMKAAYTRRDLSAYYRLNAAIHRAFNAAACNPVLTATYNQVNARLQALRFRSNQDGEKWARAMQEHDRMIEALQKRDGAALRAELVAHLGHKRDVVIEQLRALQAPQAAQKD